MLQLVTSARFSSSSEPLSHYWADLSELLSQIGSYLSERLSKHDSDLSELLSEHGLICQNYNQNSGLIYWNFCHNMGWICQNYCQLFGCLINLGQFGAEFETFQDAYPRKTEPVQVSLRKTSESYKYYKINEYRL